MSKKEGLNPPPKHLSIRIPWHDTGWEGNVCQAPDLNSSCIILDRVAPKKVDSPDYCLHQDNIGKNFKKGKNAGFSIEDLDEEHVPACMENE